MLDFFHFDAERTELFHGSRSPRSDDETQGSADKSAGTGEPSMGSSSREAREPEPKSPQAPAPRQTSRETSMDWAPELPQLGRRSPGRELQVPAEVQELLSRMESIATGSSHRVSQATEVSGEIRSLIRSTIRQEIEVSAHLHEFVRSAIREEMNLAAPKYLSVQVYNTDQELLNMEVERLRMQFSKLAAKVDSMETRIIEEQESVTSLLVARTSHLDNRLQQMMSFCSAISHQGDNLRLRLDGLTRQLDVDGPSREMTWQSLGETCFGSSKLSPMADRVPSSGFSTARPFTPQVIPCHTGDLMTDADMDVPTEGSAVFNGAGIGLSHQVASVAARVRGLEGCKMSNGGDIHMTNSGSVRFEAVSSAAKEVAALSPGSVFSSPPASTWSISSRETTTCSS